MPIFGKYLIVRHLRRHSRQQCRYAWAGLGVFGRISRGPRPLRGGLSGSRRQRDMGQRNKAVIVGSQSAPLIVRRSRSLSGSRLRRGKLPEDEHAHRRSLKGGGVYREWMDLRLTPKVATMDITFLVFIVGLGAMLAAELAP